MDVWPQLGGNGEWGYCYQSGHGSGKQELLLPQLSSPEKSARNPSGTSIWHSKMRPRQRGAGGSDRATVRYERTGQPGRMQSHGKLKTVIPLQLHKSEAQPATIAKAVQHPWTRQNQRCKLGVRFV